MLHLFCRLESQLLRLRQSPTFWSRAWGTCWMNRHPESWLCWSHSKSPLLTSLRTQRFVHELLIQTVHAKQHPKDLLYYFHCIFTIFGAEYSCGCLLLSQSDVRVPDFPANEARGSHTVPFTRTIFIEQSDFREVREKTQNDPYSLGCRLSLCNFWIADRSWWWTPPFCRWWRRATSVWPQTSL